MYPDPVTTPPGTHYELTTHLIALEVIARGWQPVWLRPALFVVDVDGRSLGWNMSRCTVTSTIGAELTTRKDYSRRLLAGAGLPIAAGGTFPSDSDHFDDVLACARRVGWPVIVKPASAGKGRGVLVADNEDALGSVWRATSSPRVIVERRFAGDEGRFLVVDGRCVAVAGRIPAHVIGDGTSNVAELAAAKDAARQANPHLAAHRLPTPAEPDRVPAAGERIVLDHRGGFSSGADSIDLTDTVHPTYRHAAERAYAAFPQLGLAGVDIMAADWSHPAAADNHIIVEVNSRPAIGAHHYPWEGKPRDVAGAIVQACGVPVDEWSGEDNDPDW